MTPLSRRRICLTPLDECFDASVHQPRDTQNWSLHINDCEAHSKFFALTPEVYSPRTVVFQQLTGHGLERGTWSIRQCSMLGCSGIHQKLTNSPSSHLCIIKPHHKFTKPARLRVALRQRGDRARRGLRNSS